MIHLKSLGMACLHLELLLSSTTSECHGLWLVVLSPIFSLFPYIRIERGPKLSEEIGSAKIFSVFYIFDLYIYGWIQSSESRMWLCSSVFRTSEPVAVLFGLPR
ncbi:hypothetical protein B0H13DRAFT_2088631 [Mycena leptocephala]|nr:hypothetical protein B0H13DRAFT_2088631 [Mycena leptocephala]